jgi:hypothetical protein
MNDECGMMNEKQAALIHHSSFRIHHFYLKDEGPPRRSVNFSV